MTAEYMGLKQTYDRGGGLCATSAAHGVDKETIYTCYVMDASAGPGGRGDGAKDLLMNPYDTSHQRHHGCTCDQRRDHGRTRRRCADCFSKYDLLCLPVVDHEDRLVGIVTVDDVVDVMEQEATEDFEKMAAMASHRRSRILRRACLPWQRTVIVWLLVLMISSMITGGILAKYEAAIAVMPLLVTFIPMLTDTGGNAGSQSSTMVIRGMAVGRD